MADNDDGCLCIGLMSGTSMDGIDVALIEVGGWGKVRLVATHEEPYPAELRRRLVALVRDDGPVAAGCFLAEVCQLNVEVAEAFAAAAVTLIRTVNGDRQGDGQAGAVFIDGRWRRVSVIGSHGQTVYHIPQRAAERGWRTPSTLQLGDASTIAARVGVATVGQLRLADMAEGGVGAPIMPLAEAFLFGSVVAEQGALLFQNIGGIANATLIGEGGRRVVAFDSGPGNALLDVLMSRDPTQSASYDKGGAVAASGRVIDALLQHALSHPYFAAPLPKATGWETFGASFLDGPYWALSGCVPEQASTADLLATAAELTAVSICRGYRQLLADAPAPRPRQTIVSGGGSKNSHLMNRLRHHCAELGLHVVDSQQLGVPADAKEAVGMAILGYCHLVGLPGNVPSVTGAAKSVVLGQLANPVARQCSPLDSP